jgi:hypothetical protein
MKLSQHASLGDLFGEPPAAERPKERPPFDLAKLTITAHDGEPFVLDLDLGEALGYGRADRVKRLIDRLEKRPSWGSMRYRDAMILVGKGARREVRQGLLTEKQVVLVCMACELPNIDEVQSLIADVFIAWRHGRVRAADAQTEVKLQEATDRAYDHVPAMFEMFTRFQRTTASEAARVAIAEVAKNDRRYPTQETVRIATAVIDLYYRGFCPCCQCHKVCPGTEGTHWGHMKGRNRREVLDGWFICAKCNRGYENSNNTADIYQAYISYHSHVKAYLVQGNLL